MTAANAFAAGVSPAITGADVSRSARAAAWLNSARSVRDGVAVGIQIVESGSSRIVSTYKRTRPAWKPGGHLFIVPSLSTPTVVSGLTEPAGSTPSSNSPRRGRSAPLGHLVLQPHRVQRFRWRPSPSL